MTPREQKANGKNVPGPGSVAASRRLGTRLDDPLRLGIIDDHPVYRLGLRRALNGQSDLSIVWDLGSASDLARMLKQAPVDVVLMDVNLGGGVDGVTAAEALKRERHPV
jgi:DNA-binding NarL/FixJ family response regulator